MEMTYRIDGADFKDYGVYVSSSAGLLGSLKVKRAVQTVWEDECGYGIDEEAPVVWEARSITLQCFMCADDSAAAVERIRTFAALFYKAGVRTLSVCAGGKEMDYGVILTELADVRSVFGQGSVAATFTLKLEEPCPVL